MTALDELLLSVRQMYAAIDRFDAIAAAELGVDRTALRAINAMECGSVGPGALGAALGLSSGSVTAMLDRLERAGHIERSLSQEDGRRRDARLTEQARDLADRTYSRLGLALSQAFSGQDELRLRDLAAGLAAISAAFQKASEAGEDCAQGPE